MCDRKGLLLAEPFSVSVSATNVVVRISHESSVVD